MVLFCLFQRVCVWFSPPTLKETPVYGTVTRGDPVQGDPVHLLAPPRCGTAPARARTAGPAGGVPGGHAWLGLPGVGGRSCARSCGRRFPGSALGGERGAEEGAGVPGRCGGGGCGAALGGRAAPAVG